MLGRESRIKTDNADSVSTIMQINPLGNFVFNLFSLHQWGLSGLPGYELQCFVRKLMLICIMVSRFVIVLARLLIGLFFYVIGWVHLNCFQDFTRSWGGKACNSPWPDVTFWLLWIKSKNRKQTWSICPKKNDFELTFRAIILSTVSNEFWDVFSWEWMRFDIGEFQ